MPFYLSILREASVASIYVLFILVILLLFTKGRIRELEFSLLFFVWLPIAVISQFLMTYYRLTFRESNLFIMNIYFMIEFGILTYILLCVRRRVKGIELNRKTWLIIITAGILLHFIYELDSIHSAAMLYIIIVYFHLTVSFIDLNNIESIYNDPYSLLNITIFTKAFGYSYFLIYQTDYKFPLIIFSGVNLFVQILFAYTLFLFYKKVKNTPIIKIIISCHNICYRLISPCKILSEFLISNKLFLI